MAIVAAFFTAAYASHPWSLPLLADALIVDDGADRGELAFATDGAAALEWVAEAVKAGRVRMIGLKRVRPTRLIERGLLPDPWNLANQQLDELGVPEGQRWTMPGRLERGQDFADGLAVYLEAHPDADVLLVGSRFRTRRTRFQIDRSLEPHLAARVHVVPVDSEDVSTGDWWKTRDGQRTVVTEGIRLMTAWMCGPESESPERRSDADFTRAAVAP